MLQRMALCVLLSSAGLCFCSALPGFAEDAAKSAPQSLNELSMEVSALQTLHQFRFTPEQKTKLKKLAAETSEDAGARQAVKASEAYRRVLLDLRSAMLAGKNDEQIGKLEEKLEKLRESEKPEVDDGVEITDEARRRAPEVLGWLSARQVATHLAGYGDQFPDPRARLLEALNKVRGLKDEEWKQLRDDLADEVSHLVAGLDDDKVEEIHDRVVQLLIQARALKDDEFKKERTDLEKTARQIVGEIGPLEVLQHFLERTLAELLSNPRLAPALEACLKK
jgi:hypothetical protein